MDDSSVAKRLVDAVISDFPDHKQGTRPVHTIGIGVDGYFVASDVARSVEQRLLRGQPKGFVGLRAIVLPFGAAAPTAGSVERMLSSGAIASAPRL